jgi:iron complex outermembrane receptor protein
MFSRRARLLTLIALTAVLLPVPAFAQSSEARLAGVVRDATGAPLPGATVTLTSATGATQTAISAADGSYGLAAAPGTYSVAVALKGFGRQVRRDVHIAAGAPSLDFALEPQREEEVTVTAMMREQSVSDVPFSVAAPTESVLRARGVDDMEDLAANVAGFTVQNLGPGQSQVAMRGVSAGQVVRDQPGVKEQVGAYLDGSNISLSLFTPDLDLFDVARVEVLRGPQGTLFGAGSLSGTVRYITHEPELGARRWFAEVGGGLIDGGGPGGHAKLGVNAPLGKTAALRAVGYYNRFGGYIDAVQPDLRVNEDVNGGDRVGGRASLRIAPNERLSIVPRVVYQRVAMDGWNRIDAYNILGNPFTTSRPAVTLGEREQFTQIEEPFTDDFVLGDLEVHYDFGSVALTSITSYTHRDVLVVRDATALTGSITGGSIGLPERVYTLDAPLDDATTAKVWTQELRLSGGKDRVRWVAGVFYGKTRRDYGQSLLVNGFEDISGIPTQGQRAAKDVLFFSDLGYDMEQLAGFGEATLTLGRLSLTGGLRYYDFNEDREQIFDGLFANDNTGTSLVSNPGSTDASGVAPRFIASYKATEHLNLNAQASRGFRLGGINDPLNVPLCTPEDLVTFSGRDAWDDETAWNYEVGGKARVLGGRGTVNVAAFNMDIRDLQATVTAGSCSSRVIFNVPKSRSRGLEAEITAAPSKSFEFSLSGTFNDSELRSSLTSTSPAGVVSIVSGIESGNRLPTVPEVQIVASATYQRVMSHDAVGYLTGTYQHIGSRFTQIGDQAEGFGTVDLLSFAPNTIGGPLTATTFRFDPELPAYDIVNLRLGMLRGKWDVALFVQNLTDERALLALDQERGTRARVGFLTNTPRTIGLTARVNF